jgi:hypothetical protein
LSLQEWTEGDSEQPSLLQSAQIETVSRRFFNGQPLVPMIILLSHEFRPIW